VNKEGLDKTVLAICKCEKERKAISFRTIKNKWPRCECKQPMIIKPNSPIPKEDLDADSSYSTSD
jgi:hypothetical protein